MVSRLFSNRVITVGGSRAQLSRYSTKFQGPACLAAPPRSVRKENKPSAASQASYGTGPGEPLRAFLTEYQVVLTHAASLWKRKARGARFRRVRLLRMSR